MLYSNTVVKQSRDVLIAIEICFLGTSSGVPTKQRNVSAIALSEKKGKAWYLIDCGEATQHQLLHTKYSLHNLGAIFITHVHGDHCYGLPGLIASAAMSARTTPLIVVAPHGIEQWFRATAKYTALYIPFDLSFVAVESMQEHLFGDYRVNALPLSHRVPSYAYSFLEHTVENKLDIDKLAREGIEPSPVYSQLQHGKDAKLNGTLLKSDDYLLPQREHRKIVIAGDNDAPSLLSDVCKDAHLLVHEATYSRDYAEKAKSVGHSYAQQVATFAQSISLPNLLLTHFSPRFQDHPLADDSLESLKQEAEAKYQGNLYLARDLEHFELTKDVLLQKLT